MTRKLILAALAAATLGAAAFTPTAASAHMHRHWGWGWGYGYVGPTYVASPDCFYVKKPVQFADGSWRIRRVWVCN